MPASALTIGRPEGKVWIGMPLDLRVPVQLQDAGGACPSVSVKLGENRLPDSAVITSVEPGPSSEAPWLRIRSNRPMDEPVVTVSVKVGCSSSMVREFALLADPPPVSAITAPTGRAQGSALPPAAVAPRQNGRSSGGSGRAESVRPRESGTPRQAGGAARSAVPAQRNTSPRLRVDALDPRTAGAAAAAAATAGASVAAEDYTLPPTWLKIATRIQNIEAAAAAPVGAASAPESAASAPELEAAQRQAETLRTQVAQRDRTIEGLRGELSQARQAAEERPWWLWPLLLLLALLAVLVGLLWRRSRKQAEEATWWQSGEPSVDAPNAATSDAAVKTAAVAAGAAAVASDRGPDTISTLPPKAGEPVSADKLLDVQQQAEFCMSLGQVDQAVAVLADHLDEYGNTSPLMYMELLRLLHSQGRDADYNTTRRECRKALGVDLPSYEDFSESGLSLAGYPEVVERIEQAWPHREVLGVIEGFLFQPADAHGRAPFDLPAYRELLSLYGAAQEHIAMGGDGAATSAMALLSPSMPMAQPPTAPLPLSQAGQAASGVASPLVGSDAAMPKTASGAAAPAAAPVPTPAPGTIDFDLSDLEASTIDTIPHALRRDTPTQAPAAATRRDAAAPAADAAPAVPNDFEPVPPDFQLFDPEIEDSIKPGNSIRKPSGDK